MRTGASENFYFLLFTFPHPLEVIRRNDIGVEFGKDTSSIRTFGNQEDINGRIENDKFYYEKAFNRTPDIQFYISFI